MDKQPIYSVHVMSPRGGEIVSVTGAYATVVETATRVALEQTEWENYAEFTYMIRVVRVTR